MRVWELLAVIENAKDLFLSSLAVLNSGVYHQRCVKHHGGACLSTVSCSAAQGCGEQGAAWNLMAG